ncbi:MAG: hypothetical protein J0L62_02025 [Bacteroidetes bacterium]|nr:hypothetical protein [Bacteroidota bacterium]
MKTSISFIFTFLFLFFTTPASSQDLSRFTHEEWTTDDGLPQNTVLSISQTRDGYIWLATYEGLVRFNGAEFKVFDKNSLPGLTNKSILTLAETSDSSLWVGTRLGVNRFKSGKLVSDSAINSIKNQFVRAILEDRHKVIWIGTESGLGAYQNGSLKIYTTEDGLVNSNITALEEDQDGRLWIGTSDGLQYFQNGKFYAAERNEELPNSFIRSLLIDHDNVVWVGTSNGLVKVINGIIRSIPTQLKLPNEIITTLIEDRSGAIWIGTEAGLVRWIDWESSVFSVKDGLSNNKVRSLFQDQEGTIWIGTNVGLNNLRQGRFSVITSQKGLSDDFVRTVFQDKNETIWVGTGSGLNAITKNGIINYPITAGLPGEEIISLAGSEDGTLFIGTGNNGFSTLKRGVFKNYSVKNGLLSNTVRAILAEPNGIVWIGTNRGLNRFDGSGFSKLNTGDGLSGNIILSLAKDKTGRLWIGTASGLNSMTPDGKITVYHDLNGNLHSNVFCIYPDANSNIWVGTDNGLLLYKSGSLYSFNIKDGLYDDIAFQILEDTHGNLWMSCNKGIYEIKKQDLLDYADGKLVKITCKVYGKSDGLKTSQCNGSSQPAGWKLFDGSLTFPTAKGLAVVYPEEGRSKNSVPPPVVIENVLSFNESILLQEMINLAPGKKRFEFHYAALTFIEPEKVRFRYFLEGFDEEWVDAGSRRIAYYTNLPPGHYTFKVIAANKDGVWNLAGASASLYLEPFYYQTWWFWTAFGFLVISILAGLYFYRVNQFKFHEKRLQNQVAERTKEIFSEKEKVETSLRTTEAAKQDLRAKTEELEQALIQLRKTQSQLIQSEKMISVGQLTAGIAHELNNPINYIFSAVLPLRRDVENLISTIDHLVKSFPENTELVRLLLTHHDYDEVITEIPVLLEGIEDGARRTELIVRSLRNFSRLDEDIPKKIDLLLNIENTLFLLRNRISDHITIIRDFEEIPMVDCYPGQLNQVFMNLLQNSLDALSGRGTLTLKSWLEGNEVYLSFQDDGTGIPDAIMPKIFDPFFSTKEIGQGVGLGLFVCYGIIKAHQGHITVSSRPGIGTTVTVMMPVHPPFQPGFESLEA